MIYIVYEIVNNDRYPLAWFRTYEDAEKYMNENNLDDEYFGIREDCEE